MFYIHILCFDVHSLHAHVISITYPCNLHVHVISITHTHVIMHVVLRNIFLVNVCMYNVHTKQTSFPLSAILRLCLSQHPSIVSLHYAFQTNHKLYLILEYLRGECVPICMFSSHVLYCRCVSKLFGDIQTVSSIFAVVFVLYFVL